MRKLIQAFGVFIVLCVYIVLSQFSFKAFATTPEQIADLEVTSICYWKNLDTFESKQDCWKWSYMTEAWSQSLQAEYSRIQFPPLASYWSSFSKGLGHNDVFVIHTTPRPPPGLHMKWVKKYWYIGVVKIVV